MILPFIAVIATPLLCSLADRTRSHRNYFTIALVLAFLSMVAYVFLPLTMTVRHIKSDSELEAPVQHWWFGRLISSSGDNPILLGPWIFYCIVSLVFELALAINTCLSDSFAVLQAEESGTSFGRIIVWGTIGWAITALILSYVNQATFLPRLVPGLLFATLLLAIDVIVVSFWTRSSDFSLSTIPAEAAKSLTSSSSPLHKEPSDYLPLNEAAKINLGTRLDRADGRQKRRMVSIIKQHEVGSMAATSELVKEQKPELKTISSSELDSLPDNNGKGNQRPLGITNDPYSSLMPPAKETGNAEMKHLDQLAPASAGQSVVALTPAKPDSVIDSKPAESGKRIIVRNRKRADSGSHSTSLGIQLQLLFLILIRRRVLIRFFMLFIISGFFMSMHWNYFFLYLEHIYRPNFELISALSMVGQSLLGELPFFILSREFISFFGRSHTISLSIISIGLRFLLYRYMLPNVSMYLIFLADCLQGPNYGLFYVVMTEVGLEYSHCDNDTIEHMAVRGAINRNDQRQVDSLRLALRSTIQSVAFACYEGIGVGLGSLAGGWMLARYDFDTMWLLMAVGSILVGLANIGIEFSCRESDPDEGSSDRYEFDEALRAGTLRKVASPNSLPPPIAPIPLGELRFQRTPGGRLQRVLAMRAKQVAPPPTSL